MTNVTLSKVEKAKLAKLNTKSAKIRYLLSKNHSRSEVAAILGIRYQHVRNVEITPVANPK